MSGIALCYARKSLVRTASDEVSPARQRAAIVKEAERHGWDAEVFEDAEGHRSGRTERRPGWIHLKSRLDDPLVKAVIVESLSRASRSIRDLFNFIHELDARGIAIISLKEQVDTTTAMGRAFFGVIAVLNQFESDVASDRMKMTIAFKKQSYGQHWGFTPFGCVRQGTEQMLAPSREGVWRLNEFIVVGESNASPFLVNVPAQWFGYADAVRRCCELYTTSDYGLVALAEKMNDLGFLFRDRYGMPRPFHTDDVRRIIDNIDLYRGPLPYKAGKDADPDATSDMPKPTLPSDLCDRVEAVHQTRHSNFGRGGGAPKRVYLIANLYCAECGAHLRGEFVHGDRYYRHSDQRKKKCSQPTYVRADKVERAVFVFLECFKAPEEMKKRIREKARRLAKQSATPEWTDARRKMASLDGMLERLKILFIQGEIDDAEYHQRKAKIEAQRQEFSYKLRSAPPDVKTLEDLLPKIDQIAAVIREGDPAQQRLSMTALFERVQVLNGEVSEITPRDWARPFFNGAAGNH